MKWPDGWQPEARDALSPFFGTESRIRMVVDPPTAIFGTVLEGFVYLAEGVPMVIDDHSGRPDVYPWPLLRGPVLRVYLLRPRRKPKVLFAHPDWTPRHGE